MIDFNYLILAHNFIKNQTSLPTNIKRIKNEKINLLPPLFPLNCRLR
jgi:hypothetical protein